jgi:hypothetical protein
MGQSARFSPRRSLVREEFKWKRRPEQVVLLVTDRVIRIGGQEFPELPLRPALALAGFQRQLSRCLLSETEFRGQFENRPLMFHLCFVIRLPLFQHTVGDRLDRGDKQLVRGIRVISD